MWLHVINTNTLTCYKQVNETIPGCAHSFKQVFTQLYFQYSSSATLSHTPPQDALNRHQLWLCAISSAYHLDDNIACFTQILKWQFIRKTLSLPPIKITPIPFILLPFYSLFSMEVSTICSLIYYNLLIFCELQSMNIACCITTIFGNIA